MTRIHRVALAALVATTLAAPAWAQAVTQADIQRLQDSVYLAERDVTQLQGRDAARASQLSPALDALRDEGIYLKVKLRKDGRLTRTEFGDVRDRIDEIRTRATSTGNFSAAPAPAPAPVSPAPSFGGNTASNAPPPAPAPAPTTSANRPLPRGVVEIPSGTELDVRMQVGLNSGTTQVEDRFEATTLVPLDVQGQTVIPAGSVMRGVVTTVEPATRTNRTARMTVSFDQVTVGGRSYPMRGTVTQAIEGEGVRGELGRTGAGAAVGGILGAVLGGAKGAVLGAVIGGGGTIAATEGKEVDLPQGTVLRVRIDSPLQVSTSAR